MTSVPLPLPGFIARPALVPVAVTLALMAMVRQALRVSVVLADHDSAEAMTMSPLPLALAVPAPLVPAAVVCRVTLPVASASPMAAAAVASTVRS